LRRREGEKKGKKAEGPRSILIAFKRRTFLIEKEREAREEGRREKKSHRHLFRKGSLTVQRANLLNFLDAGPGKERGKKNSIPSYSFEKATERNSHCLAWLRKERKGRDALASAERKMVLPTPEPLRP